MSPKRRSQAVSSPTTKNFWPRSCPSNPSTRRASPENIYLHCISSIPSLDADAGINENDYSTFLIARDRHPLVMVNFNFITFHVREDPRSGAGFILACYNRIYRVGISSPTTSVSPRCFSEWCGGVCCI